MRLRKRALGLSMGLVWGLTVFVVTLLSAARGHGATLVKLEGYYPGFSVSYIGAGIGFFWGFISGFLGGILLAWFYGLFSAMLYGREEDL